MASGAPGEPGGIAEPGAGGGDRGGAAVSGAALDVAAAARRIAPLVLRTPLLFSPDLSEEAGRPVHLKLETLQRTGSFKVRGAANRILTLTEEERARGVVACSSGNHGRAVAYVAGRLGVSATVFVPEWVDPDKLRGIREAGARAEVGGETYDEAEGRAFAFRDREGAVFVHPFDDLRVIEGQGTVGLEIVERLGGSSGASAAGGGARTGSGESGDGGAPPPTVVVPLSGGGLVAGVAHAVKGSMPHARIVAVSARRARVMWESLRAGRPVEWAPPAEGGWSEEETRAGALAGGIGLENRHTFRMVSDLVDGHVLVEEEAIAHAMARAFRSLRLVVEGGGAVGLAALLEGSLEGVLEEAGEGPLVIVVSGGNVELGRLAALVAPSPATGGG